MATARETSNDRDSASGENKFGNVPLKQEQVDIIDDLPDPDAGLSEEERALHVSHLPSSMKPYSPIKRTKSSSANSTSD
jgi:hypothetical protein